VKKSNAKALTQRITTELIKTNEYIVLERSQIKRILREQKFQSSGVCSDISCAVEVGKVVGAKYVVLGTVSKFGKTYTLDARLVDVESSVSVRSGDYTTSKAIDNLLLQGVESIVKQLNDSEDAVRFDQDEPDNKKDIVWKTKDYISYFRVGLDLEGDFSTYEAQQFYEPLTGFTLGYEYAQPNGYGIGIEFQFYRELISDYTTRNFGYDSIYFIWNSTFSNGFSLFSKGGYSAIKIDEGSTENYKNGLYIGVGFRRAMSNSMHMELGINLNFIDEELDSSIIEHQYSRPYVGISFLF